MSKTADELKAAHAIDGNKDAADHLGLNYKSYVDKVYALALNSPTEYSFLIINNNSIKDSDNLNLFYAAIKAKI